MGYLKTQAEITAAYGYTGNTSYYSHKIYLNLMELYISTFNWQKLPKGLSARILEQQLYENHSVCIFRIPFQDNVFLSLPYTTERLNVYGEPAVVNPVSPYLTSGLSLKVGTDCVIIRDNKVDYSVIYTLTEYARDLTLVDRTIRQNLKQQGLPYIYAVSEEIKKSVQDLLKKQEDLEPHVVINKNLEIDKVFKQYKNTVEFNGLTLHEYRRNLMNEVLTFIGIPNEQEVKKERMVANEVMLRTGLTNSNYFSRYDERLTALNQMQEIWPDSFKETEIERSCDTVGKVYDNDQFNSEELYSTITD